MYEITQRDGYKHKFLLSFLKPQYWLIWLSCFALFILAFIPFRIRDLLAKFLGILAFKYLKKTNNKQFHRAKINLELCFPDLSEKETFAIIKNMMIIATQITFGLGEIAFRRQKHLQKRSEFQGLENIYQAKQNNKNIILLVPHSWAIDASGVMLNASCNLLMCSMYNPHRNALVDWLWNIMRERFDGKMHTRQNGIKKFLADIKKGRMGYFLPDEDLGEVGEKISVFSPFFAEKKATLPVLHKIAKVSNAEVIPMFATYNAKLGKYQMKILPALKFDNTDEQSAKVMNETIEFFVKEQPEQYMWILRLFQTRKDGKNIYQNN